MSHTEPNDLIKLYVDRVYNHLEPLLLHPPNYPSCFTSYISHLELIVQTWSTDLMILYSRLKTIILDTINKNKEVNDKLQKGVALALLHIKTKICVVFELVWGLDSRLCVVEKGELEMLKEDRGTGGLGRVRECLVDMEEDAGRMVVAWEMFGKEEWRTSREVRKQLYGGS